MNSPTLTLRGVTLTDADLDKWRESTQFQGDDLAALAFCRDWTNGVEQFVLRTSGSTGPAKQIVVTRQQMEASARATAAAIGLEAGMHALVCVATHYVAGTMMLVRGLVCGLHMTLIDPSANPLADFAGDFDFAAMVPLQVETILDAPGAAGDEQRARLHRAHAVLIGGAPISSALEERIKTVEARCYHTYGMTETVSHVALRRMNGDDTDDAFCALPGVEIALDERDCLRVRGPMTNSAWIQTNDIVHILDDRRFLWLGRADNVINSGGIKVPVEQLERSAEPVVRALFGEGVRFFIAGAPDARLGERIVLVLESEPIDATIAAQLLDKIRVQFDRHLRPRDLYCVSRFAQTPTGKVDRKATVATWLNSRAA